MKSFIEKFNAETGGTYSFLKLTQIDVNVKSKSVTVNFIYPESLKKEIPAQKDDIEQSVVKILNSALKVTVKLTMSHFDREFFLAGFKKFLSAYPAIETSVEDGDINVCDKPGEYKVIIALSPHIHSYCAERNIFSEVNAYINLNYCDKIELSFIEKESVDIDEIISSAAEPEILLELDDDSGRYIRVENVDAFIGSEIYDRAVYIEDAVKPNPSLVVCGRIAVLEECSRKTSDMKYYRITLDDSTGKLNCLYFPSKFTKDKITLLKQGREVILRGSLEEDKFNKGVLVYMIKSVSFCTLPKDFKPNLMRRKADSEYRVIFPKPYVMTKQSSLFEQSVKKIPAAFLMGKTFCAFDIETTGFNPIENKIIEIAAVKIVDGIFTETFSTFVDPEVPISERISSLTGITDKDVFGQPTIDKVLPDFYKFIEGTVLVGQNARQFDIPFVSYYAKKQNIYIDNTVLDTLDLSRKYFPGLRNYQLQTLAEHFNVSLEGAHRAINDTIATAEIFSIIAEKLA